MTSQQCPTRALVAPEKFKGSPTAAGVPAHLREGWAVWPRCNRTCYY